MTLSGNLCVIPCVQVFHNRVRHRNPGGQKPAWKAIISDFDYRLLSEKGEYPFNFLSFGL